ncbi:MAG TPA: hypothetical protein VGH80_11950 [Xanthomonadaceae bacterium]|jgi:hypothetical protein
MPKIIAAQGSIPGQAEHEGLYIKDNKTWSSPPGGWMAHQSGKWEQVSMAGVSLQSTSGGPNIFMAGLVFEKAKPGDSGQLRDQVGGQVGTWKVIGTT